jgi:hypothetical protein
MWDWFEGKDSSVEWQNDGVVGCRVNNERNDGTKERIDWAALSVSWRYKKLCFLHHSHKYFHYIHINIILHFLHIKNLCWYIYIKHLLHVRNFMFPHLWRKLTAPSNAGSLFYLTTTICHFLPLLYCTYGSQLSGLCQCDKLADKKQQPTVIRSNNALYEHLRAQYTLSMYNAYIKHWHKVLWTIVKCYWRVLLLIIFVAML